MVIESLLYPTKAERRPWKMFFVGILYNTIAVFLALWIFNKQASFAAVFFTVLAAVPLIYNTLKFEEAKDLKTDSEKTLLHEHNRAIWILSAFFLGVVVSSVAWYVFLPQETVNSAFAEQIKTISQINNQVSSNVTGFAASPDLLFRIFFNNLKVTIFTVLFAFIYCVGSVFIFTWNATVIAVAIGNSIRGGLAEAATSAGLAKAAEYFGAFSYGFLRYAIHGIPEILAYFYAGIAGGIISVAVIRNHFSGSHASTILLDASELLLISLGFLVVGAVFEVYVTPAIF
ncbi:MAG: stage II sporulation protein M [Nanoarchaeota archaeon]|nr:stage II sporulation protein M [Nanoarchaeota archaeon]